jgi:cytochrome c peroxidase
MNDQIMNVILSKEEFNTTPEEIVGKLKQSEAYKQLFKKVFYAYQQPTLA